MTAPVVIEFAGLPVAKQRPRLGKGGHVYTPSRTRSFEAALGWLAKIEMRGRPMLEGPLSMEVVATLPTAATSRPDSDNLLKAIADALQGVVFADDAAIVRALIEKPQGQPGLVIEVRPL